MRNSLVYFIAVCISLIYGCVSWGDYSKEPEFNILFTSCNCDRLKIYTQDGLEAEIIGKNSNYGNGYFYIFVIAEVKNASNDTYEFISHKMTLDSEKLDFTLRHDSVYILNSRKSITIALWYEGVSKDEFAQSEISNEELTLTLNYTNKTRRNERSETIKMRVANF